MKAVNFDFLSSVSLEDNNGDSILVKLSSSVNQEKSYVIAECKVKTDPVLIGIMVDDDPQNEVDALHSVQSVSDVICTVDDFDNIHAIEGMPFALTPQQVIDINYILLEKAELFEGESL